MTKIVFPVFLMIAETLKGKIFEKFHRNFGLLYLISGFGLNSRINLALSAVFKVVLPKCDILDNFL
jgi:hypothetical protein